jgi:SAM-dependent methyltransferase
VPQPASAHTVILTSSAGWQTKPVSWYTEHVVPRVLDVTMRREPFGGLRARAAAGLDGQVLEIGFGSGLNVPYYPAQVRRVLAVDPSTAGRRLAARRIAGSRVPVEFTGLDAGALPVADATVDHVLCTWTLCTVPDPERALAEIRRVLRPGGTLHFVEHGRSPDPAVARWQHRLTPLQRRLAGGCRLDRPIAELIAAAGLRTGKLATYYLARPRAVGYTYEGTAIRP